MTRFDDLKKLVLEWACARQIVPNAKPHSQLMKTGSELGELLDAELKADQPGIIDGIGDVLVTLIIYAHLKQVEFPSPDSEYMVLGLPHEKAMDVALAYGVLVDAHRNMGQWPVQRALDVMVRELGAYAYMRGVALETGLAAAYREIKDRKGTLLPNGCFVKDAA